ncbi:MAG: acyl-CoA dehydrogenase [Polyangiales bacterium]
MVAPTVKARDRESRWDPDLFAQIGQEGLLGTLFPTEYGGSGLSALGFAAALEGFAAGCGDAGLALAIGAHTFLCAVPIFRLGTDSQRRRYLPKLCTGEWLGAFAHHESRAGSDAVNIETCATRLSGGWLIDGRKTWVTNGSVANVVLVTAVTDSEAGAKGISTFLVDRETRGLTSGQRIETFGMRTASISEVILDGCEVSDEQMLGPLGSGLEQTCRLIQRWERGGMLAAWIGILQALFESSVKQSREHLQFGRPIGRFQTVRAMVADIKIRLELCRRLQRRSAWHLDRAEPLADRDIAVAKLFISDNAQRIARDALQLHGCRGLESDHLASRVYRDAMPLGLLGGSNEIVRSIVAGSIFSIG